MSGSVNKTACPSCSTVGALSLGDRLVSQPLGSFSLSGVQLKTSARRHPELACAAEGCGFRLLGEYENGTHAVFPRPSSEVSA